MAQFAIKGGMAQFTSSAQFGIASCNLPGIGLYVNDTCTVLYMLTVNCPVSFFGNLVVESGAQAHFTTDLPVIVSGSVVAKNGSIAYFGGGFLQQMPLTEMEVGEGAVVTVARLMTVANLSLAGMFIFTSLFV